MYAVELISWPSGDALGQPAWRNLTIDRALNGGTIVAFTVANDDQTAHRFRLGSTVARVWEDGTLRFQGRLREPLTALPGLLQVTAGSPYTLLDRRFLLAQRTYTAVDQGAIIRDLVNLQNGRSPTGLYVPAPAATVTRTRVYESGKSVQEAIAQMAAVEDGPYLYEEPYTAGAANQLAQLLIRHPSPGADRPGARFEYGEGTLANLTGYNLNQLLPVNWVTVVGDADDNRAVAYDEDSLEAYGLFEQFLTDPDVSELATLQEKADARIRAEPTTLIEIEPVPYGPSVGGPRSPRLWHDFDVGDTVHVTIRDETTSSADEALIVAQARLSISADDDSEQVELTLQRAGEGWE